MNRLNKIVSIALTATTAVWASGALLAVPAASAQSTTDLQAQIAALLAQIQQLQSKLNTGGTAAAYTFSTNLTVGSKGADVTALQGVLQSHGYLTVAPTGYFGAKTKAALAAWQKDAGISPASGYFGPKSRAALNAMVAAAPAPAPSPTPGSPAPAPAPSSTSTSTAPATGLSVALSSQNPAAGALISSSGSAAARVPVLALDLTAGTTGAATVTSVSFHKTGVISDSSIAGAYLTRNGQVIAQYNSISGGVINFSGLNFQVPAGQKQTIVFAIDPSTGLTAGNTTAFSLNSATDINSTDASGNVIVESGAFPITSNIFTVTSVTNPSIATLTVASTSVATTVTAGTTNNIVGAWNFTANNSKVWLKGVNFRMIGSANKTDLKNVKLYVNGAQVGSTLASVAADGTAYFDLSATPGTLNTASNNVQLYADVMGSPSYNFQFEILNSYDVYAVDSQYNVPVSAASNVGTLVSIQTGTVTVSQSAATPTGNLAPGQSGITVAQFTVYAAGEAVKIKFLDFKLTFASTTITGDATGDTRLQTQIANVALTDDAGGQLGTTISTPPTANTCPAGGTATANSHESSGVYTDCFGTAASPINYIVPANTTRVLSLKMDVKSTANFVSVVGSLAGNSNNLQGLTSSATGSSGSAQGASLSLSTAQLTVAQNTVLGSANISKNSTNVKVGSYALSASSADGVTISSVSIKDCTGSTGGSACTSPTGVTLQNLKVLVAGTQFGTTQGLVSGGTYSFSGTPFTVPKGGTVYVDVYADVLSGGVTSPVATQMTGLTGTGITSFNAVSLGSTVTGQGLSIAGQPTLTVTIDSATPAAGQLVMGSTGNPLALFRFTETSNVENVKITDLNVFDQVVATTTKAGFGNVALYNGSTLLGTAGSAIMGASTSNPGPGYIYQFHFGTPVVIPQANSITLTLKGDVSSYASSGASDNTTHVFKIATSPDSINTATSTQTVVALGNSSNATTSVTLTSPNANAQTLLRTRVTVTGSPLGTTTGRSKTAVDDLATLNFAADAAGALQLNTVVVTFSGSAPSSGAGFYNGAGSPMVQLYDPANGTSYNAVASSTANGTLTYNLNSYTVSAGTTKSFNVRINSAAATALAQNGVSQTLSITISAAGNVVWTDALDNAATGGLNLNAVVIPINVQSVSYAAGT